MLKPMTFSKNVRVPLMPESELVRDVVTTIRNLLHVYRQAHRYVRLLKNAQMHFSQTTVDIVSSIFESLAYEHK